MSDLGINLWNLVIQLIAFIAFLVIFWKLALGPIVRMLDQRRDRIQESMEAAQRIQAELAATQAQNEQVLLEARREAQQIMAVARERDEQLLARAHQQAQTDAEQLIQKAQATIAAEHQQAWQELRSEVADLAIAAASKILRQELNSEEHARLIEETLAEAAASSNGRALN